MLVAAPPDWATGSLFAVTCLLAMGAGFAAQYVTAYVIETTSRDLRLDILQRVMQLPLATIESLQINENAKDETLKASLHITFYTQ